MVMAMPWKPHVAAWMALLGACRIHGNVDMAECVARRSLGMEPDNAAHYGLVSNIYAAAGNRHPCELKYCSMKALPPRMVHMTKILPNLHTLSLKYRIILWNS